MSLIALQRGGGGDGYPVRVASRYPQRRLGCGDLNGHRDESLRALLDTRHGLAPRRVAGAPGGRRAGSAPDRAFPDPISRGPDPTAHSPFTNLRKVFTMQLKYRITAGALALGMAGFAAQARAETGVITMGLIPADNNETMIQTFEPMRAYLEKKIGMKVKMFTATDYAGVVEAMRKKRIDIAWFGPLSYYLAEQEAGAEAFAVGIRVGSDSPTYKSILVAPCNSGIKSFQDLKGKNVAFVDPASTSGNLMPTFMLKQETGQLPQQYFGKFIYAGSHDAAELAVKNKTVDAAADDDITYEDMLAKGLISKTENCIVTESEPLPGSPLVYRGDLPADLKHKIQDAIVNADKEIKVTGYGQLSRYVAVGPKDYQLIRDMVKSLGLQKKDLLK
jgi:phosphonate transport system substrate-binding protein